MPKNKEQKKQILNLIIDKLKVSKAAVFVSFNGLNVKSSEELRNLCRENDLEYLVVKKTLLRLSLKKLDLKTKDQEILSNEVAVIFSYNDEITGAKIAKKFLKDNKVMIIKGGIFENEIVGLPIIKKIASIPGREELYAKLIGGLNAPVSGFINVLKGNLRGLVQSLNAIKEKK
ncbi:MAG: 50S ribosomal protein L10 [Xanthomonadaceae bacterium]|nr:50S ribosomal protein L10 [Rhodospirillaceae bacterium]NIA17650.1 50S ribosomal protein L10 [Xanthomonadaceae bacterium]